MSGEKAFDWVLSVRGPRPILLAIQGRMLIEVIENPSAELESSMLSRGKQTRIFKNHWLMPGLVNGHTHLPMSIFRGYEDDLPLQKWLFERIFPLEAKMTKEVVALGTKLSLIESLQAGTTIVNDMYFFYEETAQILSEIGMSSRVGVPMMDFPTPGEDPTIDLWKQRRQRIENFSKMGLQDVRVTLSPHAPYTCNDDTLKQVKKLRDDFGFSIHIHVSETEFEENESQRLYGCSTTERLDRMGLLSKQTMAAHGVHLSDRDQNIFKNRNASIIHNPDSNLKLASGIAPIATYLEKGIRVGLGTDGAASNNDQSLFGTMDLAAKLQKTLMKDSSRMTADKVFELGTHVGAEALGIEDYGQLRANDVADFVIIDLSRSHLVPFYSPTSALVYAANGSEVDTVFLKGRPVVEKGDCLLWNRNEIFEQAQKVQKDLIQSLKGSS